MPRAHFRDRAIGRAGSRRDSFSCSRACQESALNVRADCLARFGSVEGVVRAGTEDLQLVHGIGKGVADKIRWALEQPPAPYT